MGLQHYTQDMSKIPLKYHINVLFYTMNTHPTLVCRGAHARTDKRKIFTQYSGISSCSLGSTDMEFSRQSDELLTKKMTIEKIMKKDPTSSAQFPLVYPPPPTLMAPVVIGLVANVV